MDKKQFTSISKRYLTNVLSGKNLETITPRKLYNIVCHLKPEDYCPIVTDLNSTAYIKIWEITETQFLVNVNVIPKLDGSQLQIAMEFANFAVIFKENPKTPIEAIVKYLREHLERKKSYFGIPDFCFLEDTTFDLG